MHYELKNSEPAFEAVTGELAGRRFEHGRKYDQVPKAYADRFKKITPKKAAPKKTAGKEGEE